MSQQAATPTQRPWVTAGVALTAASMVAAAPVAAPTLPEISLSEIQLTAFDPITPWVDVFEGAGANAVGLVETWGGAPFPILQQLAVNQVANVKDLFSLEFGSIFDRVGDNFMGALSAPFTYTEGIGLLDPTDSILFSNNLAGTTAKLALDAILGLLGVDSSHEGLFELAQGAASLDPSSTLGTLLNLSASPLSGLLLGAAGPILAPGISLVNDVGGIVDALSGSSPDLLNVLGDVLNIPAHMTGAFLNGGEMLDAVQLVAPLLGEDIAGWLADNDINAGIELGGLLSPGSSLFNAIGFNLGDIANPGGPLDLAVSFPGNESGLLGSLITLPQAIAAGIGWDPVADGMPLNVFDPGLFANLGDTLQGMLAGIGLDNLGLDTLLGNMVDIPNLLLAALLGRSGSNRRCPCRPGRIAYEKWRLPDQGVATFRARTH